MTLADKDTTKHVVDCGINAAHAFKVSVIKKYYKKGNIDEFPYDLEWFELRVHMNEPRQIGTSVSVLNVVILLSLC